MERWQELNDAAEREYYTKLPDKSIWMSPRETAMAIFHMCQDLSYWAQRTITTLSIVSGIAIVAACTFFILWLQ